MKFLSASCRNHWIYLCCVALQLLTAVVQGCDVDCSGKRKKPVCASDGRTYASKCELKRQRVCEGNKIRLISKGQCEDGYVQVRDCIDARNKVIGENLKNPDSPSHVYDCRPDGSYREIQCFRDYCWCATEDGKHISGSSVLNRKPECGCSDSVSKQFSLNMYEAFRLEYDRQDRWVIKQHETNFTASSREKQVFMWKFQSLDKDSDYLLESSEIKNLRRAVKKAVEPRVCAKDFIKRCDLDEDDDLTAREWLKCFGEDEERAPPPLIPIVPPPEAKLERKDKWRLPPTRPPPYVDDGVLPPPPPVPASKGRDGDVMNLQDHINDLFRNRSSRARVTSLITRNCHSVREDALKSADGKVVPNCQANGSYNRTQCHEPMGVCWCVDERTGLLTTEPIQTKALDCARIVVSIRPTTPSPLLPLRSLTGDWACPSKSRQPYITALHNLALKKAKDIVSPSRLEQMKKRSAGIRKSLTWIFGQYDDNGNKVIDTKNERTKFRAFTRTGEPGVPNKCGRTFYRFCDRDQDGDITLREFLSRASLNVIDASDVFRLPGEVSPLLLLMNRNSH